MQATHGMREIMDSEKWGFLVDLRRQILNTVSGIDNANNYLWWDNTTPNSTTRHRLRDLLNKSLNDSAKFGFYVVTRHCHCGKRSHQADYLMTDPYGLDVTFRDSRYVWSGNQFHQEERFEVCPCSKKNEPLKHNVIEDVIYDPTSDQKFCGQVFGVLSDIHAALEEAGDKRPRSAIREYLLRAVLTLNDSILPEPVEAYIGRRNRDLRPQF